MGVWKQNVPTRFEPETLLALDRERSWHEMTRSQYIRVAMKKWFRMVADGTVQLLDVPAQQEQRDICEQREQIEFPVPQAGAMKPLVRVPSPKKPGSHQRREFAYVSGRVVLASVAYITSRIHSTRVSRWAA